MSQVKNPFRSFLSQSFSLNMLKREGVLWWVKGLTPDEIPADAISLVPTEIRAKLMTYLLGRPIKANPAPMQLGIGDVLWIVKVLGPDGRVYSPTNDSEFRTLDPLALRLDVTRVSIHGGEDERSAEAA